MSETQVILAALSDALHDGQITEDMCHGALAVLDGIPKVFHADALKSLLGIEKPFEEEGAAPENYVAVRTFDSDRFHVGDEISNGNVKAIITCIDGFGFNYIRQDGTPFSFSANCNSAAWYRTGRNFPAIQAILEELRK